MQIKSKINSNRTHVTVIGAPTSQKADALARKKSPTGKAKVIGRHHERTLYRVV